MTNIPKSSLMKKQTFKTTNINTTNYWKIAEKYRTKIPKIPKTCIVATLHKYEFTQVLNTHTHTLLHTPELKSVQYFCWYIPQRKTTLCLTDLSLFLDNLSTLRRALSPSLSLSGLTLLPFRSFSLNSAKKRVYLCLNPTHSHTESKGNQHMLTFCVVIDKYLHR